MTLPGCRTHISVFDLMTIGLVKVISDVIETFLSESNVSTYREIGSSATCSPILV